MEANEPDGRILVFVLAYEAGDVILSVLERIPQELLSSDRWSFLCIDDGSDGACARAVIRWADGNGATNVTALHNPEEQGYGGVQKLAYRYALDNDFDLAVLLPADGQYPPEELPKFADVRDRERADVILASRVLDPGLARESGMPGLLLTLNGVVSSLQNRITGSSLSEYHTGYRAYSASFLRTLPLEFNTNDYHFDTEVLLQAFHAGARIEEFPLRVAYDRRIRRVGRVRYALKALRAALGYRMHQLGMFCSLKYRDLPRVRYEDKTDVLYSSHQAALDAVERIAPATVLDIGCGPGFVAERCEAMGARVTGIDLEEPLEGKMSEFLRVDLENDALPVDAFSHDAVLMLDVIEHLSEPERFLTDLRVRSKSIPAEEPRPRLVLSTPNVAFAAIRLNLLLGVFNYAERGILDIGHKRLFTRRSLLRALRDCGYEIDRVVPVAAPFEAVFKSGLGTLFGAVARGLARVWPTLFAFQFLVVCRPRPGLREILRHSRRPDRELTRQAAAPRGE